MSSQFDYEPPSARQPRHREHPAKTAFYKWAPAIAIALFVTYVILNWIRL